MKMFGVIVLLYIMASMFVTAYIVVRNTFDEGYSRRVSKGTALIALPTYALVLLITWLICKALGVDADPDDLL